MGYGIGHWSRRTVTPSQLHSNDVEDCKVHHHRMDNIDTESEYATLRCTTITTHKHTHTHTHLICITHSNPNILQKQTTNIESIKIEKKRQ